MSKGKDKRAQNGQLYRRVPKDTEDRKFLWNDTVGWVPYVKGVLVKGPQGSFQYWKVDDDFRPEIPSNAIRADISKQVYNENWHWPYFFYADQSKTCCQCREPFTFSAGEQKYWYEVLGFFHRSTAIRCKGCRKKRRTLRALHTGLAMAANRMEIEPENPDVLMDYAEAMTKLRLVTGQGNLERAIAAARKAYKINPHLIRAHYFEALCHTFAGRGKRAMRSHVKYLESKVKLSSAEKRLLQQARNALGEQS